MKENKKFLESNIENSEFTINGMFCEACAETVNHAVNDIGGVVETTSDFKLGKAQVKYDKTKTNAEEIIKTINDTGYEVVGHDLVNSD